MMVSVTCTCILILGRECGYFYEYRHSQKQMVYGYLLKKKELMTSLYDGEIDHISRNKIQNNKN